MSIEANQVTALIGRPDAKSPFAYINRLNELIDGTRIEGRFI